MKVILFKFSIDILTCLTIESGKCIVTFVTKIDIFNIVLFFINKPAKCESNLRTGSLKTRGYIIYCI